MGLGPQPGDSALILAGPFALREGKVRVVEGEMVTLVVPVFDRDVEVEVDIGDIGPPSSPGGSSGDREPRDPAPPSRSPGTEKAGG